MDQKAYWDSVSEKKEFTTPFQREEFQNYVSKDAKIVDIGCGYGRTLNELHALGYRNLAGFDFSDAMIERGTRQFPFLDLNVMQEGSIPLDDNSVDAVILFAVLTCIVKDADQKALIDEIRRILKPGGILYVNDFLLNEDARNLARYEKYRDAFGVYGAFELPEGAIVRHHSEDYIRQLLQDFRTEKFHPLTFTTMNGNRSNGFFFIGSKLRTRRQSQKKENRNELSGNT